MSETSEGNIRRKTSDRKPLPSKEFLEECLEYNPETGILTWKVRPRSHFKKDWIHSWWNGKYAGKATGSTGKRQDRDEMRGMTLMISGTVYYVHRVILAMNGLPDSPDVDHINGNPLDNRLENLRPATHSQNLMNQNLTRKRKIDLPRGVYIQSGRYRALIRHNNKLIYLGSFPTLDLALEARKREEEKLFGQFANKPKA